MAGANTTAIAFIGFGEVGQTFSRGLLANDGVAIRAYDLLFGSDAGARLEAAAQELGVVRAPSAQEACSNATFVFSAVTADRAEAVATEAAVWLKPGQPWQLHAHLEATDPAAADALEQDLRRLTEEMPEIRREQDWLSVQYPLPVDRLRRIGSR